MDTKVVKNSRLSEAGKKGAPKKGERRGGRQKGSLNKRTVEVIEKLEALNCDPIKGMAKIAMNKKNPVGLRASMYKELAQYIAPKRRAMEMTGAGGVIFAPKIGIIRD